MCADFSDRDWRNLLQRIENRQVLPVLGPAVVTVPIAGGQEAPLYEVAAPALARGLGLSEPERFASLNDVARAHVQSGGQRSELYDELRAVLKGSTAPGAGLRALAEVTGFDVIVSSTADGLMARALKSAQPGFDLERQVFWFHTSGRSRPHPHPASDPNNLCDLPTRYEPPLLYQILGSTQSPDFAVWEEDYMEFICSLLERADQLERLFRLLRSRDLLLIGATSVDWIVRFFLRVARGKRLSSSADDARYYLAERRSVLSEPMTFFFETASQLTRIIDGDPVLFAHELAARWRKQHQAHEDDDFFALMSEECPEGAVFISYARDDKTAVETLGRALLARSIPVWVDRRELRVGESYERALQYAVKNRCGYFISLISKASESSPTRYVHQERRWAASRHTDGYVFYLPLVLDLDRDEKGNVSVQLEPEEVRAVHHEQLADATLPAFVERVSSLVEQLRGGARPRG